MADASQTDLNLSIQCFEWDRLHSLLCVIITIVSPLFHATSEDLTDHPVVFAAYAQSDP